MEVFREARENSPLQNLIRNNPSWDSALKLSGKLKRSPIEEMNRRIHLERMLSESKKNNKPVPEPNNPTVRRNLIVYMLQHEMKLDIYKPLPDKAMKELKDRISQEAKGIRGYGVRTIENDLRDLGIKSAFDRTRNRRLNATKQYKNTVITRLQKHKVEI